ncbi:hypothetical protein Tco_1086090 [Tanacetum coccineum]
MSTLIHGNSKNNYYDIGYAIVVRVVKLGLLHSSCYSSNDQRKCRCCYRCWRARHANVGNYARGSGPVRGQNAAPVVRECTFAGFMKYNPITFHGTKGAIELQRWFEKTESIFGISECAEGKKVKFAAATLQGPALTWWNAKVATMGLETVN